MDKGSDQISEQDDIPNTINSEPAEPQTVPTDEPVASETPSTDTEEPDQPTEALPSAEPVATTVTTGVVKKPLLKRNWLVAKVSNHPHRNWVIAAIVVVVLIAGGLGWHFLHHKAAVTKPATRHSSRVIKPVNIGQTQFLTVPTLMGDLHFFKDLSVFGQTCTESNQTNCPNSVSESDIVYYRIGTTATDQPIVDVYDTQAGEGAFSFVAVGTTAGQYKLLGLLDDGLYRSISSTNANSQQYVTDIRNALSPSVTLDTTSSISQLTFQPNSSINNLALHASYDQGPMGYLLPNGLASIRGAYFTQPGQPAPAVKKLGTSGGKTYYEVTAQDQANYAVKEIYGTLNAVYGASYKVQDPLITGNADLDATWTSGDQTSASYNSRSGGCGSANGYVIAKNVGLNGLTNIGSGPGGKTIYQLPSDSALFKEIYADDYNSGSELEDNNLKNLSAQQFQDQHGVFLAQNALGELVVYLRQDMIEGGGCGKPVIYLYPTSPLRVSIKVGATITKSAPTYGPDGWQDVLALPGSRLLYQGQGYQSLFWEGLGKGSYPAITSGTVVPRAKVVATIRKQLAEQGLTQSETNDFLAYWQPKLPSALYTRLTWFDTAQMNTLAPLGITPGPSTLIRVFLDFQGLQQPVKLPNQHFSAPTRTGFTVVEWGGLLRGATND